MAGRAKLGVFSLAMINTAAILSLRSLAITADYGLASIGIYALVAIVFFIPCSLACAELGSSFPRKVAVYPWVREAFGPSFAMLAMWSLWMGSIAWFPAILFFVAANIAFLISPELAANKIYMFFTMLIVFWGAILSNFFGIRTSSLITSIGVILGTLLPGLLIILLGFSWLLAGNQIEMDISFASLFPEFEFSNLVFIGGVYLGFVGVEMSAFHARDIEKPQTDYPKALLLSGLTIVIVSVLGSLSISVVVPKAEISLLQGIMQAFSTFLKSFSLELLTPIFAFILVLGSLAGINTWTLGPARGILALEEDSMLPKWFYYVNKNNAPVAALLVQGTIGTVLALVIFVLSNSNTAYWIVSSLSAQFALISYSLVFASLLKLRFSKPELYRPYKIPGGNLFVAILSTLGIASCITVFLLCFFPPQQLNVDSMQSYWSDTFFYFLIVSFLLLVFLSPAFIFIKRRNIKKRISS